MLPDDLYGDRYGDNECHCEWLARIAEFVAASLAATDDSVCGIAVYVAKSFCPEQRRKIGKIS